MSVVGFLSPNMTPTMVGPKFEDSTNFRHQFDESFLFDRTVVVGVIFGEPLLFARQTLPCPLQHHRLPAQLPAAHFAQHALLVLLGHVNQRVLVVDGDGADASRFIDATRLTHIAPSLGGVDSLIEQPAIMSYYDADPDERLALGIRDELIRFAIGIEDTEDLVTDLDQALAQI